MERAFLAITYVQERTYSAIVRERAHVHYSIPNSKTKYPPTIDRIVDPIKDVVQALGVANSRVMASSCELVEGAHHSVPRERGRVHKGDS